MKRNFITATYYIFGTLPFLNTTVYTNARKSKLLPRKSLSLMKEVEFVFLASKDKVRFQILMATSNYVHKLAKSN